ncbi:MAG: helix-turn-helix domain-containing protein, partial [Actinomycetota bacterium]
LLCAARRLFAERGDDVTMEEVAAAAGVGKGTLYRRYPNRAALAAAVLDELARDFQADAIAGFGPEGRAATPLRRLDMFLERAVAFGEAHTDLLCLTQDAPPGEHRRHPAYLWQRQVVAGLLADAARAGEIPPQDLDYLPDAILALVDPVMLRDLRAERGIARDRVLATVRALLRGLLTQGPGAPPGA